jgi:allantoinase
MPVAQLVIRGHKVVLPEGIAPASIHIHDGKIRRVSSYEEVPAGVELIEAGPDSVVMPGLVDTHVHINEPGRAGWEGFRTATRAAAAGGVTTLVDMPLNSIPPTTTIEGLQAKQEAARGQCSVDVGFWGGVVPGNTHELAPLASAGVAGFKCFLIHSGVDEFPNVTEEDLRQAMPELSRLGALLIVHAELPGPITSAGILSSHDHKSDSEPTTTKRLVCPTRYQTFLDSRPRAAENEAVELMIRLSHEFGARIHIVHHSSADVLPLLAEAKASGERVTVETCPHYLTFAAEEIADGATEFKCCPPIRERENREQLWNALRDATIDMVVSDHSPCLPEMKLPEQGDFLRAWGGISSLQLRLPVIWTEARRRGFSIVNVAEWLCWAPARLVGLERRKGCIAVGADADVVIWNTDEEFMVEPKIIYHRHQLTPYAGRLFQGKVQSTFLRGRKVYDGGKFIGEPAGLLIGTGAV